MRDDERCDPRARDGGEDPENRRNQDLGCARGERLPACGAEVRQLVVDELRLAPARACKEGCERDDQS